MAAAAPVQAPPPHPAVRGAVRDVLLGAEAFHRLPPERRQRLAHTLVEVCDAAGRLALAEAEADRDARRPPPAGSAADETSRPLAVAQSAGEAYSGRAAREIAGTTRAVLDAVSFPRFVTELVNGVFKALGESNLQQMQQFVDLIDNVSASLDGFADLNVGETRARQWLVERFPGSYELVGGSDGDDDFGGFGDDDEDASPPTVRLRSGAQAPSEDALRAALGVEPGEPIPSGDPDRVLVPFARRRLAQQRQQMLATMVQMGLQRIVIDHGRIEAGMQFHIDTRSAAASDVGSRFDFQNQVSAAGSFGVGPWGASAQMTNTIGYVRTSNTSTTEETNTDLNLDSSVELTFHTDYLPLNQVASQEQQARIASNTRNPEAARQAAAAAREARTAAARTSETARQTAARGGLAQQPVSHPPNLLREAEQARQRGQQGAGGGQSETPQSGAPTSQPGSTSDPGSAAAPAAPAQGSPQPTRPPQPAAAG